jgi:hypothetical protein
MEQGARLSEHFPGSGPNRVGGYLGVEKVGFRSIR